MKSVIYLKKWVAEELRKDINSDEVEKVLKFIRRNTDHPLYRKDWTDFLKTVDCSLILKSL